jgi:hypothetical protein
LSGGYAGFGVKVSVAVPAGNSRGISIVSRRFSGDEWLQLGVEIGQHLPIVDGFVPSSDTVYIDGVSSIKPYAFDGCTNLVRVTIKEREKLLRFL